MSLSFLTAVRTSSSLGTWRGHRLLRQRAEHGGVERRRAAVELPEGVGEDGGILLRVEASEPSACLILAAGGRGLPCSPLRSFLTLSQAAAPLTPSLIEEHVAWTQSD